jgi:hypothetical protein
MAALNARLTPIATRLGIPRWTLTFQTSGNTIVTDADTGIEYAQPQAVIIKAHLIQAPDQSRSLQDIENPLINPTSIKVMGWCMEPYLLPITVRPMSVAQVVADSSDDPIAGQFLLLPEISSTKTIHRHHLYGYLQLNPGA